MQGPHKVPSPEPDYQTPNLESLPSQREFCVIHPLHLFMDWCYVIPGCSILCSYYGMCTTIF